MDLEDLRDRLRKGNSEADDLPGEATGRAIAEGNVREAVGNVAGSVAGGVKSAVSGLTSAASGLAGSAASLADLKTSVDSFFSKAKPKTFDADYRGRMHKALDVLMDRADRSQRMHRALDRVLQGAVAPATGRGA